MLFGYLDQMGKSSRKVRSGGSAAIDVPHSESGHAPGSAVRVTLMGVLAVTPLCMLNGVFLSHDVIPKVIATLISATVLLFLFPHWASGVRRVWNSPAGKTFLLLAAAQCASLLISTAISGRPGLSLFGTVWRRFGIVEQIATLVIAVASAATAALDKGWPASLFRVITISGGVASVYGISQYFGVDPFLDPALYKVDFLGGLVRPPATMGHAIYFAAWLTPVCLIAVASAWSDASTAWRRLHTAVAALAGIAIFLSGSRGGILALMAGGAFFALRIGNRQAGQIRRRFAAAAAILVVVITGLVLSPLGENIRHRLAQWRQDPGGPRLAVLRESTRIVGGNPVFGTGPEMFGDEFRKIESTELSAAYPDFYMETPHSALMDVACAQGVPGLLILTGVFALGIFPLRSDGFEGHTVHVGLQAAGMGILVASMFASFTIVESMYLWSIAGICVALPLAEAKSVHGATSRAFLLPVTLLACAFLTTAVALSVPDAIYLGLQDAIAHRDSDRAARIYAQASAWSLGLPVPGYELFASQQFAVLARSLVNTSGAPKAWAWSAEAAASAEKRSEQRYSAAYQSSLLAIANGDLGRAESEAREAIALAPNWYRPHVFLAQILDATGRKKEAVTEQQIGIRLGPGSRYGRE
jgi:O-antigen ligase